MTIYEKPKYLEVEAWTSNERLTIEIGKTIGMNDLQNIDLTRENVLKLKEKIEEFLEQTNES